MVVMQFASDLPLPDPRTGGFMLANARSAKHWFPAFRATLANSDGKLGTLPAHVHAQPFC